MTDIVRRIELDYTGRVKFDLELRGIVTVIGGQSSSGKTFFCKALRQAIEISSIAKEYSKFQNFVVIDRKSDYEIEGKHLLKLTEKVIVIDAADRILRDERGLIEHINRDSNNQYIIMSRGALGLEASLNYMAEMYQDKDKIYRLKYRFSLPGWF